MVAATITEGFSQCIGLVLRGLGVGGLGFKVQGVGFWDLGLGFRV